MVIDWTVGGEDDKTAAGGLTLTGLATGKHLKSNLACKIM